MRKIWKFDAPIELSALVTHAMPMGAQILDLQMQDGAPCLWALVDPDADVRDRVFRWVGTDRDVDANEHYVGTVQFDNGLFVFHLFEVTA